MLWALPLAMRGQDLKQGCAPGSLVDRVIRAGNPASTQEKSVKCKVVSGVSTGI